MYILLSESCLEEEKEYKVKDNPWMFQQVICFCERWYYKINYKYERCKHTKTKSCYKNISCWFICSFIFFNFSSLWWFKILFDVFHPTNLMNQTLKKFDQAKMFQILLYTLSNLFDSTNLIKLIWLCISGHLSIVDWFK